MVDRNSSANTAAMEKLSHHFYFNPASIYWLSALWPVLFYDFIIYIFL